MFRNARAIFTRIINIELKYREKCTCLIIITIIFIPTQTIRDDEIQLKNQSFLTSDVNWPIVGVPSKNIDENVNMCELGK